MLSSARACAQRGRANRVPDLETRRNDDSAGSYGDRGTAEICSTRSGNIQPLVILNSPPAGQRDLSEELDIIEKLAHAERDARQGMLGHGHREVCFAPDQVV